MKIQKPLYPVNAPYLIYDMEHKHVTNVDVETLTHEAWSIGMRVDNQNW